MQSSETPLLPGFLSLWEPMPVSIKRLREDAILPTRGTERSAGFDLAIPEDLTLGPGRSALVGLGYVIATPPGHMCMVVPRSSTFKNYGAKLANTVGIVDEDYSGDDDEMILFVHNPDHYRSTHVPAGSRIAQGIFVPVFTDYKWVEVIEMGDSRGGLGSTGR